MISKYGFTDKQNESLEPLIENDDGFVDTPQSLVIFHA